MGIFKRFRASMTFGIDTVAEDTLASNSTAAATYRPFTSESVFSPGFRPLEEGTYSNYQSTTNNLNKPRIKNELPKVTLPVSSSSKGEIATSNNTTQSVTVRPGTSQSSSNTSKFGDKKEKDKKEEKSKDKKDKDKKERKKEKSSITDSKGKSKKDKDKEKSKKGKEKSKDKKKVKVKNTTSTPIASVTIDEVAVTSAQEGVIKTQNGTLPPPPYTVNDSNPKNSPMKSRNVLANPLAVQNPPTTGENGSGNSGGFSSSWDQVAMHRQNLHREIQTHKSQQKNLRSMMYPNKEESATESSHRFAPSASSPRNINTNNNSTNKPGKQLDSDGSGSEADA